MPKYINHNLSRYYRRWAIATAATVIPGTTLGFPGILAALAGGVLLSLGWAGLVDAVGGAIAPNRLLFSRILPALWASAIAGFVLVGGLLWLGIWVVTILRIIDALG